MSTAEERGQTGVVFAGDVVPLFAGACHHVGHANSLAREQRLRCDVTPQILVEYIIGCLHYHEAAARLVKVIH